MAQPPAAPFCRPARASILGGSDPLRSPAVLTALILTLAGLGLLALLAVPMARAPRVWIGDSAGPWAGLVVHGGCLLAAAVMAGCGLAVLGGAAVAPQPLPIGVTALVAVDALSAWFLVLLGLAAACSALFGLAHARDAAPRLLVAYPLFLAGMLLALIAADGFVLVLGFEAMSIASWVLVAADHQSPEARHAARRYLAFAVFSGICLVPAIGLLAASSGDLSFAAIRTAPPQGFVAAAVLALVVAGAGAKAGLVPLHGWLPLAHPAAPSHVSALMSGAMTKVAIYVLARLLLDLSGPAQPLWWGVPLLVLGAASAVLGALRANLETDTKTLLACSTIENVGLICIGLGLAACFRAADLGVLAGLAAGAALLHALNHALFKSLLFLGLGEVARGAASRQLDRLGGLIHAMPWTAGAVLVGAAAAASLPPLSGFASEWLLIQAMLAAWRVGDLAFQVLGVAVVAAAALAAALAAAAMVRLFGLVFLGRPRTPRAAGAVEGRGAARLALLLPAGLTLLFGLLPGPLLALAEGAVQLLVPHGMVERGSLAMIRVGDGGARIMPLAIALLLAVAGALVWWLVRRRAPAGVARAAAWDCGFMAPPQHLPFGDPVTQPSAAGFGQPLRRMLGGSLLAAHESVTMPAPGDPGPARVESGFADPSERWLLAPLARLRDALAARAEALRDLPLTATLMLPFGTLVALLALAAWLEAG
ncbi:proton-conducting transporter transmembrane domain-containing protein [Falsiroseomonas tokyonensis]|uniref:Proton-conducting transporter membrane subunit n=1 Tax=Falsiroseomonas tokyonensis TaxID=430521 RepID=A0ABV7BSN8_9PROT|nr:proton-conducting transporter membrane subunit [Falsiroseomonas tokyonensis]MBU8537098.1 hydrogenase 4 subunit B [Falsiroseomonas tokyonensis]